MLKIEVVSMQGRPVPGGQVARFGAGGGTIGRSTGSTLVLPDAKRHISRTQATIAYDAGGFVLTDVGTLNPVAVNGRALGNGAQARLDDGDEIAIGDYVLRVLAGAVEAPGDGVRPTAAAEDDPFAGLSDAREDPFAADAPERANALDGPQPEQRAPGLFDVAADTLPGSMRGVLELDAGAEYASPDDGASIDRLFGLAASCPYDPLAPGAPLSDRAAPRDRFRGALANHALEIESAYEPPPALPPSPGVDPAIRPTQDKSGVAPGRTARPAPPPHFPAPSDPAPACGADAAQSLGEDALAEAFLRGAGVPGVRFPSGLTPELMEIFGRLLRESVQGTLDLLAARARIKSEMRADVTVIEPRNNNPLKFSPTADAALSHLLEPRGQGFLSPVAALRNAYDDLRAHQLAMMAGMRAALAGLLCRFEPQQLERRLREKSVLDNLLPMHRKARQWDLFTELYTDLSHEAEEDFHIAFGKEFRKAYEAQMQRAGARGAAGER
jgi:FHA domain-containing protein